jgi:hypothetical protein
MDTQTQTLSWTPVRRDRIFCAPACGFQCTHKAFMRATARADRLARTLGHGWSPVVWENCGWHAKVVSAHAEVGIHTNGHDISGDNHVTRYYARIDDLWSSNGPTALKALASAREEFETRLVAMLRMRKTLDQCSVSRVANGD